MRYWTYVSQLKFSVSHILHSEATTERCPLKYVLKLLHRQDYCDLSIISNVFKNDFIRLTLSQFVCETYEDGFDPFIL